MEVSFYHLTSSPLELSLPQLASKILEGEKRALIISNKKNTSNISDILWKHKAKDDAKISVIPNGTKDDKFPEKQPVYITSKQDNINDANMLVNVGCTDISKKFLDKFERCLYIFDGNDDNQVQVARTIWKEYKEDQSLILSYWQQDNGKWKKS